MVTLALNPDGRINDEAPPPAPVPLDKQVAVVRTRLNTACSRLSQVECEIFTATNRFDAVEWFANDLVCENYDDDEERVRILTAIDALACIGKMDLAALNEKISLTNLRGDVTAADVEALEKPPAEAATEGGGHAQK